MRAFLDEVAEVERRKITCQPIPARWATLASRTDLTWQRFPFEAGFTDQIPREPGFFCFFVGDPPTALPPAGFPLYFGRTDRTLRRRFAIYLHEQHDDAMRPPVRDFLDIFAGELTFYCCTYKGTADQMTQTAHEIVDALRPAFSDPEYVAEAQLGEGAW